MWGGGQRVRSVLLISLLGVLFFAFHNCADYSLKQKDAATYSAPPSELSSVICNYSRPIPPQGAKFIFIVDMSASNFGEWYFKMLSNTKLWYWDKTKATDYGLDRFQAIKYFLENCGNQTGAQFAVIGFSKTAGTISIENGRKVLSCASPVFSDRIKAIADLDALAAVQKQDKLWYEQWNESTKRYLTQAEPDTLIMGPTSYVSALDCVDNLVINDLTKNTQNQSDSYNVYFISDGVPQDSKNAGCNLSTLTEAQKQECYLKGSLDAVSVMRTAALSKAKDLRLYGVYYGSSDLNMQVLDSISKEGGTTGVVQLGSFKQNQQALCDLIVSDSYVEYKPDSVSALNLTTTRYQGRVAADSDMDGVSDVQELELGWDPSNPRSLNVGGVLDGVCLRLGGRVKCLERRNATSCDSRLRIGIGMTECDFKMLELDVLPAFLEIKNLLPTEPLRRLMAVDSDRDGMIDFVEIVKGTNPAAADMNADPDGDGVANLTEIVNGSDPFQPDADIPMRKLNDIEVGYSGDKDPAGVCFSGGWKTAIHGLETAFTAQLPEIVGSTDLTTSVLNHAANEHMILLLHRMLPQNTLVPISEYYYNLVPFTYTASDGVERMTPAEGYLSQKSYIQLGKVQP